MRRIVVPEPEEPRAGEADAVQDAGVAGAVGEGGVSAAQQRAEDADVGLVAGVEDQRAFRGFELRDALFEAVEDVEVAAHQARGARARAELVEGLLRRLRHSRMARQAQVVVRGEVEVFARADADPALAARGDRPQLAQQALVAPRAQEFLYRRHAFFTSSSSPRSSCASRPRKVR